jgi:CPA2 family monovalent cation:H+ antiporter-2
MAEQIVLVDLGIIVLVALVCGIVFSRLRQNSALGYILAGVILGPLALKYLVPGTGLAPLFGELGVIMILFYLGLELNMHKLKQTGAISAVLAVAQMTVTFALGFMVGKLFGFGNIESMVLGAMIVATSTVIISRFLIERGVIERVDSHIALGILMFQDFFAIFILVLLTSLGAEKSLNTVVLNALLFMIGMFFIVSKASRHILNFLHSLGHGDKMVFYAIGVGVVASYAGVLLGLSSALGAFFAGFALAESQYGERIKRELGFIREFFVLFFFVSFGSTLFYDFELGAAVVPALPALLPLVAIAITLVVVYLIGSSLALYLTGTLMGLDKYSTGTIAMLMTTLGEFVIIIANASRPLVDKAGFDALVTIGFMLIIFTSPLTPVLYDNNKKITDWFFSLLPKPIRKVLDRAHGGVARLESASHNPILHDHYVVSMEQIGKHLLVAFSIVYLSIAINEQLPQLGTEILPRELSVGFLVLLLVTWPLYRLVVELRALVEGVTRHFIHSAFPAVKRSELYIEDEIADVFTGILLTLIGIVGAAIIYSTFPKQPYFLIAPVAYTMLALMQLSRSFYSLVEHYETLNFLSGGDAPADARVKAMGREFEEHSRRFRMIHAERERVTELVREALRQNDMARVRNLLIHLKRSEGRILAGISEKKGEHMRRYLLKQAKP